MKGCLMFFIVMVALGIVVELFQAMFWLIVVAGYILGGMLVWWGAKKLYQKITS